MKNISEKARIIYVVILIIFISIFGMFWLDHIGLLDLDSRFQKFKKEPPLVLHATDDEPSLVEREEFNKQILLLNERIEELNRRELLLSEMEDELEAEKEKFAEAKRGLELEKKRFEDSRRQHAGYEKNVTVLANKMANMPPEQSVNIMLTWEDTLIIDVLRQMDRNAEEGGQASITPFLLTLMPGERAGRIMYLMTQL